MFLFRTLYNSEVTLTNFSKFDFSALSGHYSVIAEKQASAFGLAIYVAIC